MKRGDIMRGTVAKRLRRQAYGDRSLRQIRQYQHSGWVPIKDGGIVNVGDRATYLKLKSEYNKRG